MLVGTIWPCARDKASLKDLNQPEAPVLLRPPTRKTWSRRENPKKLG